MKTPAKIPPAKIPETPATTDMTSILFVDDDARNLDVLESILASPQLRLVREQTPEEALLALVHSEFACIILDINMPGMNGVELQEHLIAHGHSTPMIFITAFPEDRIRDRVMRAGAVDFLNKPFDEPRLLECVERALARHQDRPNDT